MDKVLADKINASGTKSYFCITGGGQTFIGEYLALGGASKSVVGINVPYSQEMFDEFVGKKPTPTFHYCSEEAARALAVASYLKALKSGKDKSMCFGFGVTASLAKEHERDGREHKAFIAVHNHYFTKVYILRFKEGLPRCTEERYTKQIIEDVFIKSILPLEAVSNLYFDVNEPKTARIPSTMSFPIIPIYKETPIVLFPGSFNPWHVGHQQIFDLTQEVLGRIPIVELSMVNADKGVLDYFDLENRIKSLPKGVPYVITEAATFKDKVSAIRSRFSDNPIIFVVGADTWERIWDEKYAGSIANLADYFYINNVKFLVFGRDKSNLNKDIQNWYSPIFRIESKKADNFSSDVSSTQIREGNIINIGEMSSNPDKREEIEQKINEFMKKTPPINMSPPNHPLVGDIAPRQSGRFPTSFQTVDNIIIDTHKHRILIGQKNKDKNKWRFPGGFVDPTDLSLEAAAIRERVEEIGINLECTSPRYAFSFRVNDERYRNSVDKVLTAVMISEYLFGFSEAGDDLDAVDWVSWEFFKRNYKSILTDAHVPLAEKVINEGILSK